MSFFRRFEELEFINVEDTITIKRKRNWAKNWTPVFREFMEEIVKEELESSGR